MAEIKEQQAQEVQENTSAKELVKELEIIDSEQGARSLSKAYLELSGQTEQFQKLAQSIRLPALDALEKSTGTFSSLFEKDPNMKAVREMTAQMNKTLASIYSNEYFKQLRETTRKINEQLKNRAIDLSQAAERISAKYKELEELEPFIEAEIEAAKATPGLENLSIDNFWELDFDIEDAPKEAVWRDIYLRAQQKKRAFEAAEELVEAVESVSTVVKRAEALEYPIDKVNSTVWGLLEKDTGGQLTLAMETEKDRRKGLQCNLMYSINFDAAIERGLKITRKLTAFDKRVYIAVNALWQAGNNVISLTQIHYAMGNTKRPSRAQLEKIQTAVEKMNGAGITVDNTHEAAKYNYPVYEYKGSLLPIESMAESMNGKLTDAAIHIFREPPLISFAKQHGNQITTIEPALLQSPLSKTEGHLAIEDYLIERISKAKHSHEAAVKKYYNRHKNNPEEKKPEPELTILAQTLYDNAGIKTRKQKYDAPETIKRYLEHYKACGFISGYSMKPTRQTPEKIIVKW